jgi:hypothetical protein
MRRKYLNDPTLFFNFCDYPPFEEDLDLQIPIMQDMFAPDLIEIRRFILKDSFYVKILSPLVSPTLTLGDHNLYKLKSALCQKAFM